MKHSTHNTMLLFTSLLFIWGFEYCYSSNNTACFEEEWVALLRFKGSLIDKSNRLSSWTGPDCCKWEGGFCSRRSGRVSKLDLHNNVATFGSPPKFNSDNGLGGGINPSLINLTRLEYLDLSHNSFYGIKIPKFFGTLKSLRYLNLSRSGFMGKIPTDLRNLSSLEYLDLSAMTYLTSDNLNWLSGLSSLRSLDMSGVFVQQSEGWLHTINNLVSLSSLNLAGSNLNTTDHISRVNSTSLVSLNLESNSLEPSIFLWLSNLTRLENLDLAYNYINYTMPADIFDQLTTSLKSLHLSCNNFTGIHNLVSLDLSENYFSGLIPNCFGNLTSLTSLRLHTNSFTGPVPSSFFSCLCQLQELHLFENKLSGVLPLGASSDCAVHSLQRLRLRENRFTGQLPNQLYKYKNLEYLDLSANYFFGTKTDSLGNLSMLFWLSISDNNFSGNIPSSLGELSNLKYLDIESNSFHGVISESHFLKLENLEQMSISQNSFVLNVSSSWVPPPQLDWISMDSTKIGPRPLKHGNCIVLDLSHNRISGELPKNHNNYDGITIGYISFSNNAFTGGIPEWLCNLHMLETLVLSNNKLSGEIPLCLGELQSLGVLDLADNNLSGRLPNTLGSLFNLQSLQLRNNKFQGELPSSLQNLSYLMLLDLSRNEFEDVIPSWIGEKLSSLIFLTFHGNGFYGDIPSQLCQLRDLLVLDLANNNISGYIPRCFDNFTSMISDSDPTFENPHMFFGVEEYNDEIIEVIKGLTLPYTKGTLYLRSIDLSGNHLVDKIPIEITSLRALQNLNLSGNHLSGTIPDAIGNLSKLESLDLSRNSLSGHIPLSLPSLNFLSHLNLSFNKLYGRIPTGSQLQTLNDASIYLGNEGLCGALISKSCPGDKLPSVDQPAEASNDDDHEFFMWLYSGIGPGVSVGFIGVLSILVFKRSWRYAYFRFLDMAFNKIFNN